MFEKIRFKKGGTLKIGEKGGTAYKGGSLLKIPKKGGTPMEGGLGLISKKGELFEKGGPH